MRITRLSAFIVLWLGLFAATLCARAQPSLDYRIAPQDIIVIDVVGEKDLGRECRVSATGTISFAWLKNVEVKGKTPAEVEELLTDLLNKDYLVDPQVIVNVKEYRTRTIMVLGAVFKPGAIPIPGEQKINILDGIALAGGPTKLANQNKIEFTRGGKTEVFTMDQLKKMNDPTKMIFLDAGDIINLKETVF